MKLLQCFFFCFCLAHLCKLLFINFKNAQICTFIVSNSGGRDTTTSRGVTSPRRWVAPHLTSLGSPGIVPNLHKKVGVGVRLLAPAPWKKAGSGSGKFYALQKLHSTVRIGTDLVFLPDRGYPTGLFGIPCRIFGWFILALPDIRPNPY